MLAVGVIRDLAGLFPYSDCYRPIEEFAQRVQLQMLTVSYRALKTHAERAAEHQPEQVADQQEGAQQGWPP